MKDANGFYTWQYNGVATWEVIYSWCEEHFGPTGWYGQWDSMQFEREKDYTAFLLRWA